MSDILKVFINTPDVSVTPTLNATSIPVITTAVGTTAVLKDIKIQFEEESDYPRKTTLSLDGFPLNSVQNSLGFEASGSQIMNESSSLSVEIAAETTTFKDFRRIRGVVENSNAAELTIFDFHLKAATFPTDMVAYVGDNIASGKSVTRPFTQQTSYSGTSFVKNGSTFFAVSFGNICRVYDTEMVEDSTFTFSGTVYAIEADDTYIYGFSNSTTNQLQRFNHQTGAMAANLVMSTSLSGYGQSNKGFTAIYGDTLYHKFTGSQSVIKLINTSTGVITNLSTSLNQTEFIGGAITVSTDGTPYLLMYGDLNCASINLTTNTEVNVSGAFYTQPTTTNTNQVMAIGAGVVLVNNGSYSTSLVMDINSGTIEQTLVTSAITLGGTYSLMVSDYVPSTIGDLPRSLSYSLIASGVEST
tara:strand:+ start:1405 stop:2649 length:1245 start_codon:yes stop_codon:yes gene_type:complete